MLAQIPTEIWTLVHDWSPAATIIVIIVFQVFMDRRQERTRESEREQSDFLRDLTVPSANAVASLASDIPRIYENLAKFSEVVQNLQEAVRQTTSGISQEISDLHNAFKDFSEREA